MSGLDFETHIEIQSTHSGQQMMFKFHQLVLISFNFMIVDVGAGGDSKL